MSVLLCEWEREKVFGFSFFQSLEFRPYFHLQFSIHLLISQFLRELLATSFILDASENVAFHSVTYFSMHFFMLCSDLVTKSDIQSIHVGWSQYNSKFQITSSYDLYDNNQIVDSRIIHLDSTISSYPSCLLPRDLVSGCLSLKSLYAVLRKWLFLPLSRLRRVAH